MKTMLIQFPYSTLFTELWMEGKQQPKVWGINTYASHRISVAGITSGNVQYLAEAIHEVTK